MKRLGLILLFVAIVLVLQAGIGFVVYKLIPGWPERSQFGDMFGVVNTLFSGLAFAGLLYMIMLQKDELALQREELRLTRTELQRTAKAQEASEKALAAQVRLSEWTGKVNAINHLLDHFNQELRKPSLFDSANFNPIQDYEEYRQTLMAKRQVLLELQEQVFADVTSETPRG